MLTEDSQDPLFDAHKSQVIIVDNYESPNIFPSINDFSHQLGTNWAQGDYLDSNTELFSRNAKSKLNNDIYRKKPNRNKLYY